ncbi:DUF397 domain-containing protein [Streptomyces sp. NBC_00557]|uniref:DUF397 domain-containing protein n=1 Tax=Streptomyces sp. NBC_00557 TaxID=2975776 RepID=UPI002E80FEEE|nr:DUF397 domain-containing protein [Streptomyces sp. NBC_00557]WUC36661.1 DUF397 domain-containing protein [Streptomyces sp. NBC_00557]
MQTLHWQKSSYSGDSSNCVETATTPTAIHIRDSKTPTAPHLTLAPSTWTDFLAHATEVGGGATESR